MGLLVVFSLKAKLAGGVLRMKDIAGFLDNYYQDLQFLLQHNLIEKQENHNWAITPLGALTVFPYIDDSIRLVQQLILNKES